MRRGFARYLVALVVAAGTATHCLSFVDIRAEANGIPLTLTRTYDSTQRDIKGDFGWGWRAAAQDVGLRKNMVLGLNSHVQARQIELCLVPAWRGRITKATDPAGKSLTYAYNALGELETVTDRSGKVTRFDYASTARQTDAGTRNNAHLLARITDPEGRVIVQQQFDEYGRLTGSADALGQQATQRFDEQAGTLTLTNRRGYATTYSFDAAGNVTRVVDAKGGITDVTYDALGNELTRRNPLGQTVTKTFDASTGTQTSETNALNQTTSTTYSQSAFAHQRLNPKTTTDARGNVTNYGYVDDKQPGAVPTSIAEPLGRSTAIAIDPKGNLKTLNVAGIASTHDYDTQGRRIKETDGAGAVTTYTFDASGSELTDEFLCESLRLLPLCGEVFKFDTGPKPERDSDATERESV